MSDTRALGPLDPISRKAVFVSALQECALLVAGVGAGLAGSVIGIASLISYPSLLAIGLSPVSANVTNTVALLFSSAGSIAGSGPDLIGQKARIKRLAPVAIVGGASGAGLLLLTPSSAFAKVVPWLIALASIGVLVRKAAPARIDQQAPPADPRWLAVPVFAVAIYGGYFGAAAGVLILSLFLLTTGEPVHRASGLKNVILGLANGVAAVSFAIAGPVHWSAVLPMAAGCYLGGRVGPSLVRRAPPSGLRAVIFLVGLGLAVHLALDAY